MTMRKAVLLAATWCPLGAPVALGAEPLPARYVVVIGYNGGPPDERPPLAFADDDAARFFLQALPDVERAFLLTTFDKSSARLFGELTDAASPPTKKELARVLGEVAWLIREQKERGRQTELLFYFAGHGDVSDGGEGFLVLADGAFTRSELARQVVASSPADMNHLLIDACAAYFMVSPRGEESGQVPLSPALLDVLREREGGDPGAWARTGTLVSTSSAAEVHESAEVGGGVFSYLLRSALAGAGDASGDRRVEYAEAAAFIAAASSGIQDPRARLAVHAEPPLARPHVPLADLGRSGAEHFLPIDGSRPVHLRVLDANGIPYVELHRDEGPPALIALVGNPYYVVQMGEQEALLVPRSAGAYALSSLRFVERARDRRARAGPFSTLFREPFGPRFFGGFLATSSFVPPRSGPPLEVVYATGGEPPFRFPYVESGVGAFAAAGAFAVGAAVFSGMSLLRFSALEERYRQTGEIDRALAVEVEAWRTSAILASVGAVLLGLSGAALFGVGLFEEEAQP